MVYIEVLILDIYYVRIQLKSRNIEQSWNKYIIFTAIFTVYALQKKIKNKIKKFKNLKIRNKIIKI